MKDISEKLEKLKLGSSTKSIRDDLSEGNLIFGIKSCYPRDGQHGVDRTETNLGDYSVSFLPEARTRGIEHVSMWRLASTQSKYDGPDQNSICSFYNSLLTCLSNHFKRKEKWSQPMPTRSSKSHGCKTRKYTSKLDRWQNDEVYRAPQLVHGWTDEWVKYLDYTSKIDISHDAPHRHRPRYESTGYMRASIPRNKQDHCVNDLI